MRTFALYLSALLITLLQLSACKKQEIPTISTSEIIDIKNNSAISGGIITDEGSGTIISRGICWSINLTPTIDDNKTNDGAGAGNFTSNMSGLSEATTYYVRAYAINSAGTAYGMTMSFKTLVADIDGNLYDAVKIGTQTWINSNLKSTKYNNGNEIPNLTGSSQWSTSVTGAYCYYNNDASTYKLSYGALYNWQAVNSGKLCPTGWHVPTDAEWTTLVTTIGTNSVGGKLKEIGTAHWASPNTAANNETSFTALPGGFRDHYRGEIFVDQGQYGFWWSSSENDLITAWYRGLYWNSTDVLRNSFDKKTGFSVRCLKD